MTRSSAAALDAELADPLQDKAARSLLHRRVLRWYGDHARDLPWRDDDRTPWGVLVSEVMLQQTPVVRVLPVWQEWMRRWPTPAAMAADSPGEVVRAWGRLGYPRRALRLHAAATAVVERFGGEVPGTEEELRSLPGVGDYTAAAVAAFAFGQWAVVLDTNVRRVLTRVTVGEAYPPSSPTRAERDAAAVLVPDDPATAARWSVGVMELGALVCTARSPRCEDCPLRDRCRWYAAGRPAHDGPPRRGQAWAGTDRQVRGALMAVLRADPDPVPRARLEAEAAGRTGAAPAQLDRCLHSLVVDGLVEPVDGDRFRLPA